MDMTKITKAKRIETLKAAQAASARGDVATARTLFASVGISYVSPAEQSAAFPAPTLN